MAGLKSLAKQTAVYGASSIIGRFLNYFLVPLYTAKLSAASGGYGVVTNVYAIVALLLVCLTYGMETGFFRFANKKEEDTSLVYSTVLIGVGTSSVLFVVLSLFFLPSISGFLGYQAHPEFIGMMLVVVAIDAFQSILFAHLRYQNRALTFASYKLLFIVCNISVNLFFFLWAPLIYQAHPAWIAWIYNPSYGVGYAFLANLICSSFIMLLFIPELCKVHFRYDAALMKRIFRYSFPILILGLVGILNQTIDKILFPFLMGQTPEATMQLGIYGAASKVAMVMMMFTQAFRYAYEPFVFGKSQDKDNKSTYAQVMKYFIIFSLLAFLGVMFYLDLFKFIIAPDYWEGLKVVPIVMGASLFMGIYFNLSFWYKLIDETRWGAYLSLIGCVLVIAINVIFVPVYGYIACAWAGFVGYGVAMLLSYGLGQRKYPIDYPLLAIGKYVLLATVLYLFHLSLNFLDASLLVKMMIRTSLLACFVAYIVRCDLPLQSLPFVGRFFKPRK